MFEALEPQDPLRVGRYRIVARLGAGGMGQVYLARSPGGRPVAVKVVRPELARDGEFRRRFAREVTAARRVNGAFTAGVVDADPDGSPAWLATVYVPGLSLGKAISVHGPWPAQPVLALGAGLAEALEAIHEAGVVHRDLKPSNVLLATDGPRVIDFGISLASEASALTSTGMTIGTPGFMSPEQLTGQPVGPASDIFALGAVLAYTATGVGPFGTGTPHALHFRAVYEQPNLAPLPPELHQVVAACLAKQPDQRPTVAALLDQLTTAAGGDGGEQTATATLLLTEPGWMPDQIAQLVGEHTSAPLPPTPPMPLPKPPSAPPVPTQPVPETAALAPSVASFPQSADSPHPAPPTPAIAVTPAPMPEAQQTPVSGEEQPGTAPLVSAPDATESDQTEQSQAVSLAPPLLARTTGPHRISRRRVLLALTGTTLTAAATLATWKIRDNGSPDEGTTREPAGETSSFATPSPARTPGEQRWIFAANSLVDSPTVVDGVVYVGSSDNNLYAVTADTGKKIWSFPTNGTVDSAPAVANGIVYVGSWDSNLYAVDADTGKKIWSFPTNDKVSSSPAVANGIVYVGSYDNNLYAVTANTGKKIWSFPTNDKVSSSPAVANGIVYVGSFDNNLYAVTANTGKKIWSFPTSYLVSSSPAVADGIVYVGGTDKHLYAVDADTGKKIWSFPTDNAVSSSVAVAHGIVYVSSGPSLYAVDADTGKKIWSFAMGDEGYSSPTVADGVVYIGGWDNNLYAMDADTGQKSWSFPTSHKVTSSPAVANGIVYVGSWDHNLYAVQT